MAIIVALVGGLGMVGVVQGAARRSADVDRVAGLSGVLASNEGGAVVDEDGKVVEVDYDATNYLLVGSDSREGTDFESEDAGAIGDSGDVGGQRSDTIMVLRTEANGSAALLSIPRDLWVEIAGEDKSQRVNAAFNYGPETLIATVSEALDLPIHHYVQVDFVGFKKIVDTIGGVEMCPHTVIRDLHSGLKLQPGCQNLDGVQALAYARSRYYEEWDGTDWVSDPTGDRGRVVRQQLFIRAAVNGALEQFTTKPFESGDTIGAVTSSIKIDDTLDPLFAARALRQAVSEGLATYVLPTYDDTVGDAAVLRLSDEADVVLDYFRGVGPPPEEFETGEVVGSATDQDSTS